jgi:hypothetical protein
MSTAQTTAPPETATRRPIETRKRWTTAEFDRLVRDGYIEEGSRTYLWEGEIIEPTTIYPAHYNALANLADLLRARLLRTDWTIYQEIPLEQDDGTKPQPDLMILPSPRSKYRRHKPTPADVALLVEVSDTTYDRDRGVRWVKNAKTGIPQYRIVNIPERRVEVYTSPEVGPDGAPRYRDRADYGLGAVVPLNLTHAGAVSAYEGVPVNAILVDSLEPNDEGHER